MTMKVIDVSDYQEGLDYDAVVAEGIEGVIIKITQGERPQSQYWMHLNECLQHGLKWGVYCYGEATTPDAAKAEANEVLYVLQEKVPPLGIWYDVEEPCMFGEGVDTTACVSAFISTCNAAGYKAGVYSSALKFTDYMINSIRPNLLASYVPYWVADYDGYAGLKEDFIDRFSNVYITAWQYSGNGNIGGIEVDLDIWYGFADE